MLLQFLLNHSKIQIIDLQDHHAYTVSREDLPIAISPEITDIS
jgi:hypothetical protein